MDDFLKKNKNKLVKGYEKGLSTYELAEQLGTYPNKVRRALKKLGIDLRSKSDAQKAALASGRAEHPTEGKERTEEVKTKISEQMHENWSNISDEERERRSKVAKKNWKKMTAAEKENLRKKAISAVREAAKHGSKLEVYIRTQLEQNGYKALAHHKGIAYNRELELDILLPDLNVVIEVDGPSHFLPIWGQASLDRQIRADNEKAESIKKAGLVLIRIKNMAKDVSEKHKRDAVAQILPELKKIEKKFPPKKKRVIEIEVT